MDGESSYESDVSESWSLVDINLNDEPVTASEAYLFLHPKEASRTDSEIQREGLVRKDRNKNVTTCCNLNSCDSKSEFTVNESYISDSGSNDFESDSRRGSEERSKIDSCDAESIEILNLEGNSDSDLDKLDISTIDYEAVCPSDNEELFYKENADDKYIKNCASVIKRKRRKLSRDSDSSKDSINSYSNSSEIYLKEHASKAKPFTSDANSQPVYKHYRNNVANTVLSLSVGVIFAGVACIAIGHFLGVQDAGETSVEMLETLKKLQKENHALQSRLSNLNRAFTAKDINSKSEIPSSISTDSNFNDIKRIIELERTQKVHSLPKTSNSIEWLSKLHTLVKNKEKCSNNENSIAFDQLVTYIHDGLTLLSKKKEKDARLKDLEEADEKVSKTLQKIIDKLASSQDNIEILYEKLFKLKNKLNKKLNKIFPNYLKKQNERKILTSSGTDFNAIQWKQKRKETDSNEKIVVGSVGVYKFPQPEEYYVVKKSIIVDDKNQSETFKNDESKENTSGVVVCTHHHIEKEVEEDNVKERKEDEDDDRKVRNKRNSLYDVKKGKEKKIEKKRREGSKEKETKRKKNKEGSVDIKNNFEKSKKVKHKMREKKNFKVEKGRGQFSKKRLGKIPEKSEHYGTPLFKLNRYRKNKNGQTFFMKRKGFKGGSVFNTTGYWVFKWADGREKYRCNQKVGEWQFERAKGRKELRDEDYTLNWQLKRAAGRESDRNDARWYYDKYKLRNYNGKGLFREEFSWM